jgi:hypothetical protein
MTTLHLFKNKGLKAAATANALTEFTSSLSTKLVEAGYQGGEEVARAAIALEGYRPGQEDLVDDTLQSLNTALESLLVDLKMDGTDGINKQQRDAAIAAGVLAGDPVGFWRHNVALEDIQLPRDTENAKYVLMRSNVSDSVERRIAMEAYDEKENKNAMVYSVAYNMQAAKQDAFAEMFFPTVVVTPDQVGFTMSIRLINVYDEVRRDISGKASGNFGKRNIVQAVIDPTILRNDQTRVYPVVRPESQDKFSTLVAPKNVMVEGVSVTTAPLAINKKFSLLGLAQTEVLLQTGILDSSDALDTAIGLDNIYVSITNGSKTEVLKFQTTRLPLATFSYAPQDNYRVMQLNFSTESLLVNANTTLADGSTSTVLANLVNGKYTVRLGVSLSGKVNCELGDTSLMASDISVESVRDQDGNLLDMTQSPAKDIVALFNGAKVDSYDLEARMTNSNRRQRGQLLDTSYYNQIYAVPLRSPITIPRPLTTGDANDSADLAALITATHIRTTNAAIDELLRAADMLAAYVSDVDALGTTPDVLGVTRFLVQPFYERKTIDVAKVLNSISSKDRPADLQAVLVNYIRDTVYRMYRDSGYKAAADALAGGVGPVPTVIIGTDPVIARYLMVDGDLRTLAGSFEVRIQSTLNVRMAGKIVVSFGEFNTGKDGVPNPMHFGNMAWKPELTLVLPLHRNGANSKELTVQPSFLHVVNLPIMAVFDVVNISAAAVDKTSIDFNNVTPTP